MNFQRLNLVFLYLTRKRPRCLGECLNTGTFPLVLASLASDATSIKSIERHYKKTIPAGIFHSRTRGQSEKLQSNGETYKRNQTPAEALLTISTIKLMQKHYQRKSKLFQAFWEHDQTIVTKLSRNLFYRGINPGKIARQFWHSMNLHNTLIECN